MMLIRGVFIFLGVLAIDAATHAGEFNLQTEGGTVWFSRNDVRIPGDGGTKFDMLDLTGHGPDAYIRLYATYDFNNRHALRLTYAPLQVDGTGRLHENVTFRDEVFTADAPVTGTYRFNTYRVTYRWTFHESERWLWGLGAAALVRDAEIALEQAGHRQSKDDLGVVPLLHVYGAYQFSGRLHVVMDAEGAWSPRGRAIDAALKAEYDFESEWYVGAGYRTLEGGADNDDVFTFAWIHYALVEVGYRF